MTNRYGELDDHTKVAIDRLINAAASRTETAFIIRRIINDATGIIHTS